MPRPGLPTLALALGALWLPRPSAGQAAASDPTPRLFAPGVISTGDIEFGPAFEPDGKTVYFSKGSPGLKRVSWILVSRFVDGAWKTPEVASFSGRYSDIDPTLSPDGKKLFFASTRPTEGTAPRPDFDLWVVEKTPGGWGEPHNLGAPVNGPGMETTTSVTANGTLYFSSGGREGGRPGRRLFRSRLVQGRYEEVEPLPAPIDGGEEDSNQWVSPDGSVLIYSSRRSGADLALYITRFVQGAWTAPADINPKLNADFSPYTPLISPDGKTFYFTSQRGLFEHPPIAPMSYAQFLDAIRAPGNGLADIYSVPIGAIPYKPGP